MGFNPDTILSYRTSLWIVYSSSIKTRTVIACVIYFSNSNSGTKCLKVATLEGTAHHSGEAMEVGTCG